LIVQPKFEEIDLGNEGKRRPIYSNEGLNKITPQNSLKSFLG
jgi:hypothetical protein